MTSDSGNESDTRQGFTPIRNELATNTREGVLAQNGTSIGDGIARAEERYATEHPNQSAEDTALKIEAAVDVGGKEAMEELARLLQTPPGDQK